MKAIWIILIIIIIGLAVWFFYPKKKIAEPTPTPKPKPNGNGTLQTAGFPLRLGSKGEEVLLLQAAMNKYHRQTLKMDSIFKNEDLKALQLRFGVSAVPAIQYNDLVAPYRAELVNYLQLNGILV